MSGQAGAWRQAIAVVAALVGLNLGLTFANVWPTLSIRPTPELSVELAVAVLVLALVTVRRGRVSSGVLRGLAIVWVILVLGRYVDATARSLYGRDVNLYWDLRHLPSVTGMFAFVADPWLRVAVVAGVVLVPLLLYAGGRVAWGVVARTLEGARPRGALVIAGALVVALGVAQLGGERVVDRLVVAEPMTAVYARELGELAYEASGAGVRDLGPAPSMRSDFARVEGADVLLVFLESYGATAWDRPELREPLAESRGRFLEDIEGSGRRVVTALAEATTFGGESWLSHISLLSGTEVRDQGTNTRLMAQERETLPKAFGRAGYRTVAVFPGVLVAWPQGAFYGFDDIYDLNRLDYRGPPFGWWSINDQFALARLAELELDRSPRPPVFAVFATISTHAPFVPTPPYQDDWPRMLTSTPYDDEELDRAWSDYPDWLNLGPSYVKGFRYAYATLGGFLRQRAPRDLVLVVVGDHQPPALVSGEDASWNVPVHVVSGRDDLLTAFRAQGFRDGLEPRPPVVARMDELLAVLLRGFGEPLAARGAGARP